MLGHSYAISQGTSKGVAWLLCKVGFCSAEEAAAFGRPLGMAIGFVVMVKTADLPGAKLQLIDLLLNSAPETVVHLFEFVVDIFGEVPDWVKDILADGLGQLHGQIPDAMGTALASYFEDAVEHYGDDVLRAARRFV